jgi:alkanesulfonate monooxygenase SsuD/methylene tetrahydromethanopterin reductase-like flavin-dependent oxidoreductase (luciferase family)
MEDVTLSPRPVQRPRLPILIAGAGDRLLDFAAREADIVALGLSPTATESTVAEKVDRIRQAAGERFEEIEISLNFQALVVDGVVDERIRARLRALFRVEIEDLLRLGSVTVLEGPADEVADRLRGFRERLGVSYFTFGDELLDAFAPVVARLGGWR